MAAKRDAADAIGRCCQGKVHEIAHAVGDGPCCGLGVVEAAWDGMDLLMTQAERRSRPWRDHCHPLPATIRLSRTGRLAARPRACRRITCVHQNWRKQESRNARVWINASNRDMAMTEHADVVISRQGRSTGLMRQPAGAAGVDVAIVDGAPAGARRLACQAVRAPHPRSARSAPGRRAVRLAGQLHNVVHFHVPLDISDFPLGAIRARALAEPYRARPRRLGW